MLKRIRNVRKKIETLNEADTVVYTTEKLFDDMKGKVSDDKLEEVRKEVTELKNMLQEEKKDTTKIRAKLDEINKKMQDLSVEMYKKVAEEQQQKGTGTASENSKDNSSESSDSEENVVDAEFTEKEEDKPNKKSKK
jgi:molecular chaperone DnaK